MILIRLNSQRPRRREVTRRSKSLAGWSPRNNSRVAGLAMTSSAMANKANRRAHAVICRAASAGSLPGHRAAARWRGWGVAPEGAGSLGTPGRAPQQGVRRWVCGQTSASAGAGWQGVGECGRVGLREKWLYFSYTLSVLG
jgi:hypothetical protein